MHPEYISKTKTEALARLDSAKQRRKKGIFSVEGLKGIRDAAETFELETLIVEDSTFETLREFFPPSLKADAVRLAKKGDMKLLSTLSTPPSAIGVFKIPDSEFSEEEIATSLDKNELYLMLDGVRDPGNFGTIIRTADWFGIHTIYASKDSADIFNQKVIQATMGSIAHVKVIYTDLPRLVKANPELPVYGTLLEGKDIYKEELKGAGIIVMGNEGKGLSPEMRELVTDPLTIPPYSSVHGESLNVAAATAIVLYEFRRG